jgi:homopolymeric O-antigen transport system permease protein
MTRSAHASGGIPAGRNDPDDARGSWVRRWHVLTALARSDLRIRYGRGPWQLVNWFLTPFILVGVFVLLRVMLDRTGEAVGLSIACAVVPFQIVSQSSTSAMNAVSLRQPILLNRRFDTMLIPPSAVLTETLAFGTSFVMFPLTMLIYSVGPETSLVWLPVVVVTTMVLSLGAAWPSALLGIWAPKVSVFASQVLRILYFASAGLVALSEVPEEVHDVVVINPFTALFESYRHVFLYGDAPPLWELAYPLGLGALLWSLFLPLYRREKRHFAKLVTSL